MKKLLAARGALHSLTATASSDGARLLLRGMLYVPPQLAAEGVEVCSCNGTPNAARVAAAVAAAPGAGRAAAARGGGGRGREGGGAGGAAAAASGATARARAGGSEQEGGGTGTGTGTGADGPGAGSGLGAGAGCSPGSPLQALPGTCGPPERYTHCVEVLLRADDLGLVAASSSCCGTGYDALQSQLCPGVAAVMLAARLGRGQAVACDADVRQLAAAALAAATGDKATATGSADQAAAAAGGGAPDHSGVGATADGGVERLAGLGLFGETAAAAAAGGGGRSPALARLLVAAGGGAVAVGPGHVDLPPGLPPGVLPGPGLMLDLQPQLDSPRWAAGGALGRGA